MPITFWKHTMPWLIFDKIEPLQTLSRVDNIQYFPFSWKLMGRSNLYSQNIHVVFDFTVMFSGGLEPPCIHSFYTWTYISDSSFSPWRFQKNTSAEVGEVLCKWFHSQNTSRQLSVYTLPLHISSSAMLWELCYTPNNKWLGAVQTTSNASTIMSDPLHAAV